MVEKQLIDANELLKDARQCRAVLASLADIVDIEILVTDQPTVDAVEVVRCCDCQHCDVFQDAPDSEPMLMCMVHSFEVVDFTDYCSRGERRTDG